MSQLAGGAWVAAAGHGLRLYRQNTSPADYLGGRPAQLVYLGLPRAAAHMSAVMRVRAHGGYGTRTSFPTAAELSSSS